MSCLVDAAQSHWDAMYIDGLRQWWTDIQEQYVNRHQNKNTLRICADRQGSVQAWTERSAVLLLSMLAANPLVVTWTLQGAVWHKPV